MRDFLVVKFAADWAHWHIRGFGLLCILIAAVVGTWLDVAIWTLVYMLGFNLIHRGRTFTAAQLKWVLDNVSPEFRTYLLNAHVHPPGPYALRRARWMFRARQADLARQEREMELAELYKRPKEPTGDDHA